MDVVDWHLEGRGTVFGQESAFLAPAFATLGAPPVHFILGPTRQRCKALTIALLLGPILASAATKRYLEVELALNRCFGIILEDPHRKLGGKTRSICEKRGSP